jgi:hypothetical protein
MAWSTWTSVKVRCKHSNNVYEKLLKCSKRNKDVWDTESVFFYLKRLIDRSRCWAVVRPRSMPSSSPPSSTASNGSCWATSTRLCWQALTTWPIQRYISDRNHDQGQQRQTHGRRGAKSWAGVMVAAKVSLGLHHAAGYCLFLVPLTPVRRCRLRRRLVATSANKFVSIAFGAGWRFCNNNNNKISRLCHHRRRTHPAGLSRRAREARSKR